MQVLTSKMLQAKILIADDDPLIRIDLRTLLESIGHIVVGEASNGEEACYMARSLKPDLIILDVMMPVMSGLEAASVISSERAAPILMLTAYSEAPMIEAATQAGVLAYLVKPYRKNELQAAIEIAITRYRELVALETERDNLQEQFETRKVVGRAKSILMNRYELSEREAFRRLQAQSLALNRSLKEIAEAIILTEEINVLKK
jgi:response regulator NasT